MKRALRTASQTEARREDTDWGCLRWLASQELTGCKSLTVGRVLIKRGHANPRHTHPNCQEVLYLLAGRLEHVIGNERVIQETGDTLVVDAGVAHQAHSVGDVDADMIVAYDAGHRGFRKETAL